MTSSLYVVEERSIRVLTPGFSTPGSGADIQEAINIAARCATDEAMEEGHSVIIQGGRYVLTEQIIQPPYVKVSTDGPVVLETQVENDSAWWITPLAGDPSPLRTGFERTQWNSGPPLSGANGGIIFCNPDATTGAVGLELGPRTNLGGTRRLARYRLSDLTFNGLTVGVQINPIEHYIAAYDRLMFEQNTTHIRIGDGVTATYNAGENFTFNDCLVGTGATGLEINAEQFHLNFANCSLDAMTRVFSHLKGKGTVRVTGGGHMENINVDHEADGGISVVGFTPATGNEWPHVVISGYPPLVQNPRGTQFLGQQRISVELQLRQVATDYTYANAYLVDDEADVARFDVAVWNDMPLIAQQVNLNRDAVFAADADGTAAASLTHYTTGAAGTSASVEADNPAYSGAQSLKVVFTGTGTIYRSVTTKAYMPCRPGQSIVINAAMRVPTGAADPVVRGGVLFFDSEGVQIGSTVVGFIDYPTITYDAWIVSKYQPRILAPAGATKYRALWQWNVDTGADGTSQYQFTDLTTYALG